MKLHRATGRKTYCRDTLPCPKLHQRLAHKRSIPSAQRHWHLTPNFKPACCFFDKWKFPLWALPRPRGWWEKRLLRGQCVTQRTHAPCPPPRPTIPVCFVWQQLSRCKNPTLFLITQSADSIKLSLRRLHCFLSAHNNWQTPRALTASMEWSLEFWSCQIFKRRYAYMYVFTLHLFIAKDVLSLS